MKLPKHQEFIQSPPVAEKLAPFTSILEEHRAIEVKHDKLKRILKEKDLEIKTVEDL